MAPLPLTLDNKLDYGVDRLLPKPSRRYIHHNCWFLGTEDKHRLLLRRDRRINNGESIPELPQGRRKFLKRVGIGAEEKESKGGIIDSNPFQRYLAGIDELPFVEDKYLPKTVTPLKEISQKTIQNYRNRAEDFWQGTKDHDVSQNYHKFIDAMKLANASTGPFAILDFGCGPGRDVQFFRTQGHLPVGLDGCPEFCKMAEKLSGCQVLQQDFLQLELKPEAFDGIFANASLFHVPSAELPRVLSELHQALKPQGVLFSSNPRGQSEGWQGGRYGHFMEIDHYRDFLNQAGFDILDFYYRPTGLPVDQQPWLAVLAKVRHKRSGCP